MDRVGIFSPDFPLISVHVPKTAGTSFRHYLTDFFGNRLLTDYAQPPGRVPPDQRQRLMQSQADQAVANLRSYFGVHGHFMAAKYKSVRRAFRAVWIRDPVDAAISRYWHYLRARDKRNEPGPVLSIPDFFRRNEGLANPLTTCTWPHDLGSFDFVGNFHAFDESTHLFSRICGLEERTAPHLNANRLRSRIEIEITDKDRRFMAQYHAQDIHSYRRGLARFEELLARH